MHPFTVAKMSPRSPPLRTDASLQPRGWGIQERLLALNDLTPHDKRYDRVREYTVIIKQLLAGTAVTQAGEFYTVSKLRLAPALLLS